MFRILIIEDDSIMQRAIRDTLKAEGHDILISRDGEAGLVSALADKPDLIVLDVNMPGIDGLETCRRLKADGRTRHIPVIILTGEARDVAQRVEGLDLGAEDYMFKPFSPRVLAERVSSILKLSFGQRPSNG